MNIRELVAGIEVELEAAVKREQKARKEIEVTLAAAQQEGRSNLTDDEDARCEQLFESITLAKSQQEGIKAKLARAKMVEAEEAESELRMQEAKATPAKTRAALPKYDEVVRVGAEERTYHRGNDPTGKQFLTDVVFGYSGDIRSNDRLNRHQREEEVERASKGGLQYRTVSGSDTSNFSGLVVPQYLIDLVAPAVANLRPFADVCNRHPLPATGMSVNISRITTPTSAGLQTTQLNDVPGQDISDTLLTANIETYSGQALISRQAIDRGQGIEDTLLQDLMRRLNTALDTALINEATNGVSAVANGTTVSSTASATDLYPKIVGAASKSATAVRGVGLPSHVLMHPSRWYWLQSTLTSLFPLIGSPAQANPVATGTAVSQNYPSAVAGRLPCGLDVVADANVTIAAGSGTNEDEIYVFPASEAHLWEDTGAPVLIRAEQPKAGQLGVQLVMFEYAAFTMARYTNAFQKLTGVPKPSDF